MLQRHHIITAIGCLIWLAAMTALWTILTSPECVSGWFWRQ